MIKIVIADDHKIVRDGIKALLLTQKKIQVVGEASNGTQLKKLVKETKPDLILLDLIMPGESGLDVIPDLLKLAPEARILILSSEMDEETVCEAVSRGAIGFLHKNSSENELIMAIEAVYNHEPYFGQNIAGIIYKSYTRRLQEHKSNKEPKITDREKEIIALLAEGLCFKEIGERLFISPRTVENHKNNILSKLELKNTIELLRYAIKNHLIHL
jgi:DNA-binding NarL/FixJ family response regulator